MPHAPSHVLNRRHTALRHTLAARGLDALIVTSLPNIAYLTNFNVSAAILVIGAADVRFITDFRYVAALEATRGTASECVGLELVRVDASYDETLTSVLATLPRARVAFEAAHLTVARHQWLESKLQGQGTDAASLVATDGIIERLRLHKDQYEIETLREAAHRLSGTQ